MSSTTWTFRSELKDRVRVYHPDLSRFPGLRQHCAALLHRTHWLYGFRINTLSSTVVIRFPPDELSSLLSLLESCFIDPFADSTLETILSDENQLTNIIHNPSLKTALNRSFIIGSVLLVDTFIVTSPWILSVTSAVLIWPLIREFFDQVADRLKNESSSQLVPESSTELVLSTTLIAFGLSKELLVERLIGSSTAAIQSLNETTDGSSTQFLDFLDRLKLSVMLPCVQNNGSTVLCPLSNLSIGDCYNLTSGNHVYLPSIIVDGELVVLNSLSNGSSLPKKVGRGDQLSFGCSVLRGFAKCRTLETFDDISAFHIEDRYFDQFSASSFQKNIQSIYQRISPPLQLGCGLLSMFNGLTERAIGILSFSPSKDCERARISSSATALFDMRLNGVHVNDVLVLPTLSEVDHILISIDALHHFGVYQIVSTVVSINSLNYTIEPLQIIWSIAQYLQADVSTVFWGILENLHFDAIPIQSLGFDIDNMSHESCQVSFVGYPTFLLNFYNDGDDIIVHISQGSLYSSELRLRWVPNPDYLLVSNQLSSLGVSISVFGSHCGRFDESNTRLQSVTKCRQSSSGKIAVLGDVVADIPALACADVAIGFNYDEEGFISKTVCDIILAGDLLWLSRLVVLGRNFSRSSQTNNTLLVISSVLLTGLSLFATFTPLQLLVLFNAAPLLAEINTIRNLSISSSRL